MIQRQLKILLPRLLPIIYRIRLFGWWLVRPITLGVRMIVTQNDQVLLVRGHGNSSWHLPGGAVERRESLTAGARREVWEETGCRVEVDGLLGVYSNFSEYKSDHVTIFYGHATSPVHVRLNIEIAEARFFPIAALPPRLNPSTHDRLTEYLAGKRGVYGKW